MTGCRLIVNADDFGLTERVNEGIVDAHRYGIVTSTTVIATGAAFEHAVQLARTTPALGVGVHLTLTEELPAADCARIPTLLDRDGRFHPNAASFVQHYFAGRIALDEVRVEFDAQIARVLGHGVRVTHLDGHQHLHMLPGVRRIVGGLARKHGIGAIRFPREPLQSYMLRERGAGARLLQQFVLNAFCAIADASDARRPDHFRGFFFGGRLTKVNLMRVLDALPGGGVCELMCHPGRQDDGSARAHWRYGWQDELDALTDLGVRERLQARRVTLVSYSALAEP